MATRSLALRILYTINSSPQYILARSPSLIVAALVGEAPYQYATAPLKACLDAICRSSPELIQDRSRDYSVYVLDPLESNTAPMPISISSGAAATSNATSNAQSQTPRGVAVGLGLMSWALADGSDVAQATGTLIRLPTGQDAVEVIFALRETTATQKPPQASVSSGWGASDDTRPTNRSTNAVASSSRIGHSSSNHGHSTAPTDARTLATIASIQMRSQSKRPKSRKPATRSDPPLPSSEADRLMLAQDVYIGPVKKKGRPVRTTSSLSCAGEPKTMDNSKTVSQSHHVGGTDLFTAAQQTSTSGPTLQEIISLLASTTAQGSDPQSAALATALNNIDSTSAGNSGSGQNPDLVNALKTLLNAVSQQESTVQTESQNGQMVRPRSPDDEIVVLDKENVNPTAFRKRCLDEKPLTTAAEETNRDRKLSNRSNTRPDPPAPTSSTATNLSKKRTLSDFMDEKEASKLRQKLTTLTGRRDAHRLIHSTRLSADTSVHRYYPRVVSGDPPRSGGSNSHYRTALEFTTSPLRASGSSLSRPHFSENTHFVPHRALLSSPTRPPRAVSASSPVRPVTTKLRKPYVVPAWARTNTATQPRLSEQAQRALEEQEKRRTGERTQRKSMKSQIEREKKRRCTRTPSPEPPSSSQENSFPVAIQPPQTPNRVSKPATVPIAAVNYPVFASSSPGTSASLFKTPSTPKRQTPLRATPRMVSFPVTPTRRAVSASMTPRGDGSLFTPGALFTPKTPSLRSVRNTSCSPTRSRPKATANGDTQGSDGDVEDELDRELDSAMEELGSSQITMGDDDQSFDDDYIPSSSEPSTSTSLSSEPGSHTHVRPTTSPPKEHWKGLPPSSPIPPSSPMQIPDDLDYDSDDRELPVATSEAEQDIVFSNNTSEANTPFFSASPLPASESEQLDTDAELRNNNEGEDLFPPLLSQQQVGELPMFHSDSSFFDNFSDQNTGLSFNEEDFRAISDDLLQQAGFIDHDLSQFLESCKSLAGMCQNNSDAGGSTIPSTEAALAGLFNNVDHEKLAEELQGLYGGCVV